MAHDTTFLRTYMAPFAPLLEADGLRELVINGPRDILTEDAKGWHRHDLPDVTLPDLMALATAAAANTTQDITATNPICSTTLLNGERCQIVIPPAVPPGSISFTIRKPGRLSLDMQGLDERGLFSEIQDGARIDPVNAELKELSANRHWRRFLELAVRSKRNILISGKTGSGKTTLARALIKCIPQWERIITIEDALELEQSHTNQVRMVYSKGGQGLADVSAKSLLESSLRMRPDRVLLSELRDGTAFYYIRNVNSGHPGSITTVHANSTMMAFEQMTLLVKESEGGRDLGRDDIRSLLFSLVDIVIQTDIVDERFRITEVWFEPEKRIARPAGH